MKKNWLLLLFMSIFSIQANATHLLGGDFSYKCLGGDTLVVTLSLYYECTSNFVPDDVFLYYCSVSNAQSFTNVVPNKDSIGMVDNFCTPLWNTCNTGFRLGIIKYQYTDTVALSSASDWMVYYWACCRVTSISTINLPGGEKFYIRANINTLNVACNSSPVFTKNPVFYSCCNQQYSYNQSAIDPDGDSLVYKLFVPLEDYSCTVYDTVNYLAGYSVTQPLTSTPPVSVGINSGYISMNPTVCSEVSVWGLKVEEYRNGNLIGYVTRDNVMWLIDSVIPEEDTTHIYEHDVESTLLIYPNPTTGTFTVSGAGDIQVYDLFGRLVLRTNKKEIDMGSYPAGIYMVRLVLSGVEGAGESVRKLIKH